MIWVFLPAFNEEQALKALIPKFDAELKKQSRPYKIVVLDDGSKDTTSVIAQLLSKTYPVTLIRHEVNLGLGQTMRDGMEYLSQNCADSDLIVTMDCDNTHDPRYMESAIRKISEGYDLVILSRYQQGGGEVGLSFVKSILSRGAGSFLRIFFPIAGVREYSCGYRVMKASALKKAVSVFGRDFIRLPHMGFVVTPEILIKMRMLGLKIGEVPFMLHYENKPGPSKNKPLKTIAGYFALVWHYWGRKAKVVP